MTPSLDLLRLRVAQSPLPLWLDAAAGLLRDWLPASWRRLLDLGGRALVLRPMAGELNLFSTGDGEVVPLGSLPLDDAESLAALHARLQASPLPRWLLLDSGHVLRRPLTLPAAAEPRLREVLAHEIDRQTPFSVEQVSFEGRVLGRDPVSRQLRVELLVLPRARLDAEWQSLGPLAEGLGGIDVVDGEGRRAGVNLLPPERRQRRANPTRRLNQALAAAAAAMLFLALLVILDNRRDALESLRARVEAANVEVREVRALRNRLQTSSAAANFLAQTRAARPTMLVLLNDLTRRIPDDTALDKLAVNDGRLVLVGQSRAAPALVGLLQDSRLLVSPALAGAVQADPRSGRDRFTLTASVKARTPEVADGQPR